MLKFYTVSKSLALLGYCRSVAAITLVPTVRSASRAPPVPAAACLPPILAHRATQKGRAAWQQIKLPFARRNCTLRQWHRILKILVQSLS